jgi:hypothetical protein
MEIWAICWETISSWPSKSGGGAEGVEAGADWRWFDPFDKAVRRFDAQKLSQLIHVIPKMTHLPPEGSFGFRMITVKSP